MLNPDQVKNVAPWPGLCQACLLETRLPGGIEPLGFLAWDIMLGEEVARRTSAWVADDLGGRLLLHALPEHVYAGPAAMQPLRTVPLLMWLTHRSLRLLYQCTPAEAFALGRRLTHLGPAAVASPAVNECPPAALVDMMWRWIEEDPRTPAMPAPDVEHGLDEAHITPWRLPWTDEQLALLLELDPTGQRARFAVPALGREERAALMTYEDDPTVLVPVRLIFENALWTPRDVMALLEDEELREPLVAGAHGGLAVHAEYRQLTVLAPLQETTWRARLREFRDGLAERTDGEVACTLADREAVVSLCRSVRGRLRKLKGADEVYYPPLPGSRGGAPEGDEARGLRRRLAEAVALPLPEEALQLMLPGEVLH